MLVHDWTRVDCAVFHDFHTVWIGALRSALNEGLQRKNVNRNRQLFSTIAGTTSKTWLVPNYKVFLDCYAAPCRRSTT